MNNLATINYKGISVIESTQVSEITGKNHQHLMRDIRGYIKVLEDSPKLDSQDFFIESTYKNSQNKTQPCYLLTKQGCEMVANKMTGEKGILFTAEYVQAFNKMEQHIKEPKKLSALEQLQLQNQAILEVNEKVDKIQNDMPLFKAECDELQALVKKVGVGLMGGKNAPAYKNNSLRGKVYSDIQHQLRREFGVDKYSWIKHSQFNQAKEIITNYELPTVLKDEITKINNQVSFEEAM
ncbi:Rha family transcriptional regulator [Clostridium neonatale]|uniref:Rha family transcriptional regulator n=1 Tax=Clostridium neonatale TaxID=137838 RepID=UPI00291BD11C|nr:Phage regulatory protein, Rha family [Clostridium neonatale]